MAVPLLDLKAQHATIRDSVVNAMMKVVEDQAFILGEPVERIEREVAKLSQVTHAIGCANGTDALLLALRALDIGRGEEVLTTPFTFFATAGAVHNVGARPVFADIDPRTYNIDPNDIEHRITQRTKAIMPVDQIGMTCDMDAINAIAKKHGVDVIEDAAPTIGSEYKGHRTGSNAHQTVFSFHPRKVITTGEGGMITTDDDALADRARKLRAHGMSVSDLDRHNADRVIIEEYNELGFNYRMTDIQASIGLVQLRRLPELLATRIEKAHRYDRELPGIKGLEIPFVPPYATHTYQSYCLRLTKDCTLDRETLMTNLLHRGIATRRGVMASHLEKTYIDRIGKVSLPITEEATEHTMLIPLFASMTDEEQTYVIDALREELGPA